MAVLNYWFKLKPDATRPIVPHGPPPWVIWLLRQIGTFALGGALIVPFIFWSLLGKGKCMPATWFVIDWLERARVDNSAIWIIVIGGMLLLVGWMPASIAVRKMQGVRSICGFGKWRLWASIALWMTWIPNSPSFYGWTRLLGPGT